MYSPRITPELIPEIYRIGKTTGRPMTKVVSSMLQEAIRRWKRQQERNNNHENNVVNSPTSPEGSIGI